MIPCIVITRDRVSCTRLCVESLEQNPNLDIYLVDHNSTWPPMLEYLETSPHHVFYAEDKTAQSLWDWPTLAKIVGNEPYLVTDPDIVLDPSCPDDWLCRMSDELWSGGWAKVGLGLRLDDLPDTEIASRARIWEAAFWMTLSRTGNAYQAPVDTTLALYPPLAQRPMFSLVEAARMAPPYLIRHLPWYREFDKAEMAHYRSRLLPGSTFWSKDIP